MHLIILGALFILVFVGPGLWVRYVLRRHNRPRPDFPGSGGQFAQHLIERRGLRGVRVEATQEGDHYDPRDRVVRLSPEYYEGRSLTAVAVAAHEVGHALQDATGYRPLKMRTRLVGLAGTAEKLGVYFMFALPVLAAVTRSPVAGIASFLLAVASFGMGTLVHLVTLPVEWDASFRRALPMLEQGGYLSAKDQRRARSVLRAAALTYVAASIGSVLNFSRWLAILRR